MCQLPLVVVAGWFPSLVQGADTAGNPRAVPTFECVGLYWRTSDGATDKVCEASYRVAGGGAWQPALPLWFDAREQEYRGSVVNLRPGTTYEVELKLKGTTARSSLQVRTWSERFPVSKSIALPVHSHETLTVLESGSPNGYVVYAPATNSRTATIDVAGGADQCVVVKASYVILRGLVLQNARIHGVLLGDGVHDVVIEGCDISGWGRIAEDGWGKDYDAAIYSSSAAVKRIIVQRNRMHHPRSNSNNWQQSRPAPGKREPSHPEDPQAVCFWDSDGNHVTSRNNILHVTRQAISDRARDPQNDFDYDLFSARLIADEAQEKHGIRGVPQFGAGFGLENGQGVFTLSAQSPGFDAGVVLPNFNHDFTGAGPDLGAHEIGSPPMEFGVDASRGRTITGIHSGASEGPDALTEAPPYPPSPVITGLKWDSAVLKLKSRAGDNWPITGVKDDLQITAWGDGPGFDERPPRLSLGFARIWGDPPDLRAEDFASDADTMEGSGSKAIKASGLLMVEGTLHMWVRNFRPAESDDFTNARLAWSKNLGTNWTWADWHFTDTFGCPEFVQFGPDYAGARDRYVYVVSQNNDSAYGYSPEIVMARVPKDRVPEREFYEFFAGFDPGREPRWSKDLRQRQPIFKDPHGTQRIAITYNAGLKRYLLTTSHQPAGSQATHTAALGVFDAPEPWGPWTTVFYNSHWSGTNRTYHHKFPTKWMSSDGCTLWLLYSGLDGGLYTFCLKRASLALAR